MLGLFKFKSDSKTLIKEKDKLEKSIIELKRNLKLQTDINERLKSGLDFKEFIFKKTGEKGQLIQITKFNKDSLFNFLENKYGINFIKNHLKDDEGYHNRKVIKDLSFPYGQILLFFDNKDDVIQSDYKNINTIVKII